MNRYESAKEMYAKIGVDTDASNATPLQIVFWRQDKDAKNWHDRAFAHVYMNKLPADFTDFNFQSTEVAAVVRVRAKDCMDLLMGKWAKPSLCEGRGTALAVDELVIELFLIKRIMYALRA